MRVGFDGKRLARNLTGLGNYSRLVVDALAETFPDNEYVVYVPGDRVVSRADSVVARSGVKLALPSTRLGRALPSLWRVEWLTAQARRDDIDLFHGLSNELPLSIKNLGRPSVVTIHDVIFRHYPADYAAIDRRIYDYKFGRAARAATRVIAISKFTAADIVESYGVDPSKIDIIYQGCDPIFHRDVPSDEIARVKARYSIDFPYIIGVGTIESRKNQLLTLKALRGLPADLKLVLVGRPTSYAKVVADFATSNNLTDRLVMLDNVGFADLPALYAGAEMASYPSRIEGFGLPAVEASAVGTPAIVAAGSCLEEAVGSDALAVGPDDVEAFVATARRLLDDSGFRAEIVASTRDYARSMTRRSMAAGVIETYKKAIDQFQK